MKFEMEISATLLILIMAEELRFMLHNVELRAVV